MNSVGGSRADAPRPEPISVTIPPEPSVANRTRLDPGMPRTIPFLSDSDYFPDWETALRTSLNAGVASCGIKHRPESAATLPCGTVAPEQPGSVSASIDSIQKGTYHV